MQKTTLVSAGGFTAAVVASLCCIGPLVAVFLGIGSIAAFSVFEVYRPYLIGLSIALIAFAFYTTYRKREIKCEDGTCKLESGSKLMKTSLWSVTMLTLLAIAVPYLGFAPHTYANQAVDSTAIVRLNVVGMDCKACAAGVEASLSRITGVRKVQVDFENGKATIEYDGRIVKPSVFIEHINENGFEASLEKGEDHESLLRQSD